MMRILWMTALIVWALAGAAVAQAPEPAQPGHETVPEVTTPAAPASSAPTARAVIGAPPRATEEDGLAAVVRWKDAAWARLAPLRASFADISWLPVLLTLFNGLLALFAYRLWRTSAGMGEALRAQSQAMTGTLDVLKEAAAAARQTADAALLQARASVGVELPRLELAAIDLVHADESIRQALKAPAVSLRFVNHGRTTAFLTERCVELRLADALPTEPEYRTIDDLEIAEAVAGGASIEAGADQRLGELSETDVEALRLGRRTLWVYGFVAFRDFLGIEHRKGFSLRWRPPPAQAAIGGSFQPDGPATYVYERDTPARDSRPAAAIPLVLTDRAPPARKAPEIAVEPAASVSRPRAVARG
jgi:hypothetical protein